MLWFNLAAWNSRPNRLDKPHVHFHHVRRRLRGIHSVAYTPSLANDDRGLAFEEASAGDAERRAGVATPALLFGASNSNDPRARPALREAADG
jgi:hypothetical protein